MDAKNAQRREALNAANEIRRTRALLKKAWARSDNRDNVAKEVSMIVAEPPEWAATWRIAPLLRNLPQWGEVAVTKKLRQLTIQPETPLQALTPGQRLGIVELLAPELLASATDV